jgi:hypothetical protein
MSAKNDPIRKPSEGDEPKTPTVDGLTEVSGEDMKKVEGGRGTIGGLGDIGTRTGNYNGVKIFR